MNALRSRLLATTATLFVVLFVVPFFSFGTIHADADLPTASVNIDMCGASAGYSQAWADLFRVENPGQYTRPVTMTTRAQVEHLFGPTQRVKDTQIGTTTVGNGGTYIGDYIAVVHNGAVPEFVVPMVLTVGTPGKQHNFGGYCGNIGKVTTTAGVTHQAKAKPAAPRIEHVHPTCEIGNVTVDSLYKLFGGTSYLMRNAIPMTVTQISLVSAIERVGGKLVVVTSQEESLVLAKRVGVKPVDLVGYKSTDAIELPSGVYDVAGQDVLGDWHYLGRTELPPMTDRKGAMVILTAPAWGPPVTSCKKYPSTRTIPVTGLYDDPWSLPRNQLLAFAALLLVAGMFAAYRRQLATNRA